MNRNILKSILIAAVLTFSISSGANESLTIEQRLGKLENMMQTGGLIQLMQDLEQLRAEVQSLRGALEERDYEIQQLRTKQRQLYKDIEERLNLLRESRPVQQPTAIQNAAPENPIQAAAVEAPPKSSADAKAEYNAAYKLVKSQKFADAEQRLQAFVNAHSTSDYADNAYYWLGEVQLVQKKYTDALKSFHEVFKYDNSTKRPDALLKIGFSYYELEQWPQSRKFLEQLVKIYPDSSAASLAKTRLDKLTKEGH